MLRSAAKRNGYQHQADDGHVDRSFSPNGPL